MRPAAADVALVPELGGPSADNTQVNPALGYVVLYVISDVVNVRSEPTAEASFAAMRERTKLGIAIAATTRMIASTINSSSSEKPLDSRKLLPPVQHEQGSKSGTSQNQ